MLAFLNGNGIWSFLFTIFAPSSRTFINFTSYTDIPFSDLPSGESLSVNF